MGLFKRHKDERLRQVVLTRTDDMRQADQEIIDHLVKLGADLSKARSVRAYLYFPNQSSATDAADELAESGFDVGVGERERQWVARPETEMVVSADSVESLVSQLEAVAARNGGEFDGWEASPTP